MKRNSRISLPIIIIISTFLIGACSVEKNRKLLSVFFDGVPKSEVVNKNSTDSIRTTDKNFRSKIHQVVSIHPHYKSRECSKCHKRTVTSFLKTEKKKICISCHKEDKFTGKYVHGPVAVKACSTCHLPHKSIHRKLLVDDGRKLCDLCHRMPGTGDVLSCKGDNCLVCHDPHVADNRYFLNQTGLDERWKNRKENGK